MIEKVKIIEKDDFLYYLVRFSYKWRIYSLHKKKRNTESEKNIPLFRLHKQREDGRYDFCECEGFTNKIKNKIIKKAFWFTHKPLS